MPDPIDQEEIRTLEAELRQALQHQHAAYERLRETQTALEALLERARALLTRDGSEKLERPPARSEGRGPE